MEPTGRRRRGNAYWLYEYTIPATGNKVWEVEKAKPLPKLVNRSSGKQINRKRDQAGTAAS